MKMFKSGFVAIVGKPNAGKSTLMNQIIKYKIAIVSPKAQTTRNKIEGIYTDERMQAIFIDTPGIHKSTTKLGVELNRMAFSSTKDVELTLFIVDASKKITQEDEKMLERLKTLKSPLILVLNKIDLLTKSELIDISLQWNEKFDFKEVIQISALKDNNIEELKNIIYKYLPEGPMYYSSDSICSYPKRFLITELIREKILFYTQQEIPHSVAVVCDSMKKKGQSYVIDATIVVDKDSKKGIIIGKQGAMLKKIGTAARKAIEEFLQCKVNLELFVRVEKDWKNSSLYLKEFGYKNEE